MAYLFHVCDSAPTGLSVGGRQAPLAFGPAGQMILPAAVTKIGAKVDGRSLSRRDSIRFAGKTLFIAADGETGAHGVDLAARGEAGKPPFPSCRVAVGRGTVRRIVEGVVGLGTGSGCRGDTPRAVFGESTPPSAVPAATSRSLRNREENRGADSLSYTSLAMSYPQTAL
jgi:hypothetical protein